MRWLPLAALLGVLAGSVGCRSAYVEADLVNRTSAPISVLEVDYPSASFGTQRLAPGATFRYRFKVLGNGATKLTYTDTAQKEHTSSGPQLDEGSEGTLQIVISEGSVSWQPHLTKGR